MVVGSRRTGERVGVVAENALVWGGACVAVPGEGGGGARVGSAGRWAYVFVGAVRNVTTIVPVEGVGSTNIRKIGVDNCDGGNKRTTFFLRKNLVTLLISI